MNNRIGRVVNQLETGAYKAKTKISYWGSGCGSVGRAVISKPEVRGSNPVIAKICIEHLLSTVLKRRK